MSYVSLDLDNLPCMKPRAPAGDPDKATRRCNARRSNGTLCQSWPVRGKLRCRYHGGCAKGPVTPEGKAKVAKNLAAYNARRKAAKEARLAAEAAAKQAAELEEEGEE